MKPKGQLTRLLLLLALAACSFGFLMMPLTVTPVSTTINIATNYTILLNRAFDPSTSATNWNSQAVPAGSKLIITFPTGYNTSYGYSCQANNVAASCSPSGQNLSITGLFPTDSYLENITLLIINVLNPSPAFTTDEFLGYVGIDYTQPGDGFASVALTAATFSACSVTFNPSSVNKSGSMIIGATPQNTIPSTGTVAVSFPALGYWYYDISMTGFPVVSSMTCSNTTANVNQMLTCTGSNSGTKQVTASFLFNSNTTSAFGFQIGGLTSPPTNYSTKDLITITSMQNGYPIDTCTTVVTGLQPNTATLTIGPNPPTTPIVVNRNVSLRFSINLVDTINSFDSFTVVFPAGYKIYNPAFSGLLTFVNPSLTNTTVTVSQSTASIKSYSTGYVLNITFSTVTAPPSTQVSPLIYLYINRDGNTKMVSSSTIQANTNSLTFTVTPNSNLVNQNTTYVFVITTSDALLSSGRIKIDFPSSISQAWSSSSCATATGTGVAATLNCTLQANTLILSSLNSTTASIPGQTITIQVSGVVNPQSVQPSSNFNVTTYYTSTDDTSVATGSMGSITATASTLNSLSVSIVPSSYVVGASSVDYTVSFTINNPIPISGYIVLGVPYGVSALIASATGNCYAAIAAGTLSSTSCAGVDSGSMYSITFPSIFLSQGVAGGSKITLKVAKIFTNPISTDSVSSFTLATYTSGNYLIDHLTAGLSVAMTTPADFLTVSVASSLPVNSAIADYTVQLSQSSPMLASAKLDVIFPPQIVPQSTVSCALLSTSAALACSKNGQTVAVILPAALASSTSFGVVLRNVKNGPSLKPSGKFGFATRTPNGLSYYSQNLATLSVTNSKPSTFVALTSSFSPQTLGSAVTASISFTPTSQIGGYALVSLASSFTVATLSCTSVAFTGSCAQLSNTLNVTGSFVQSSMTLSIAGMTSPKTVPTDSTVFTTYDSSNYIIDQSSTDINFTIICTLPCKTCSADPTNCSSCYSDTAVTPSVYFNSQTNKCVTVCNSGYYPDSLQLKCLQCGAICATCTGTATNCTSCLSSGFPNLNISSGSGTCVANCDSGYYPDTNQSPTLCVVCVAPCVTCTTQTSCLSCNSSTYLFGTACVASCPSLTSVNDTASRKCLACDTVCASCSILTTNCTSCATSAALYLGNCVNPCPNSLVVKNGLCVPCDSPCDTCSVTSTNCTKCLASVSTPHLLGNACLVSCPTGYYNQSATSDCLLCSALSINCDLCLNKSYCITCNSGFVYFTGQCLGTVPAGYVNISGIAQPCTGDCATCSLIQSNCTSCKTSNLLGNQCLVTCPTNYAPVSGVCTTCSSPCLTCSQLVTNCTSCVTNLTPLVYLSNYQCIQTCPASTYANSLSATCSPCQAPCVTCTALTVCLSCDSTTNLYQTACLATCPAGFTAVAQVCQACQSPCQTCSTSQLTCTSCLGSVLPNVFLTGSSCVTAANCPTNTYANLTNYQCSACVGPCLACTSAAVCVSCISGYNLHGTSCTSSCLTGQTPVNSVCTPCASPCATCAGSTSTCLTCIQATPVLYLSNSYCLASCPSTTYSNGTTLTCDSCRTPCDTCSSLTVCSTCLGGYYLYVGSCVTTCPMGHVGIVTACQNCDTGCRSCQTTTSQCLSCLSGYFLLASASQCVQSCPTGLFSDSLTLTCIGCTSPCLTCSGSASNCTSCSSSQLLLLNSCVSACPEAYYVLNSVCTACPAGCLTCTSGTRCQSCISSYYLYQSSCVPSCPSNAAVVVSGVCTACSSSNCQSCNSGDQCLVCQSPYLIYLAACVSACPTNFTSNGTACVAVIPNNNNTTNTTTNTTNSTTQNLTTTLSGSKMFPVPFTIAGSVVVVLCIVSKFQNSNTFAAGAIYGLLGLFEWGALGVFGLLYWLYYQHIDLLFFVIAGSMGALYLVNFITFIVFLSPLYRKDPRFQLYLQRGCGNSSHYSLSLAICLLVCHKYVNVVFCRLFNFGIFKAQLAEARKFTALHVMSFLSLLHSVSAIGVSAYFAYSIVESIYQDTKQMQIFLSSIDVIAITLINLIMAGANAHKDDNFFVEKEGDYTLNKKIIDNDEYMIDEVVPDGDAESMVKGGYLTKGRRFKSDLVDSDSQNSSNMMLDAGIDSQVNEIVVEDDVGVAAELPPAPLSSVMMGVTRKALRNSKVKTQPVYNEDIDSQSRTGSEKKGSSQSKTKEKADVSIQALQILSQEESFIPPEPVVRVETNFENIFDIARVDRSVQGSIPGYVDQSDQYTFDAHNQSVQLTDKEPRVKTQNDMSIQASKQPSQNSRILKQDKSMQYQPSMLSEVSKKRSIRDQSAQGDISNADVGVQKTITVVDRPSHYDRSVQGESNGKDVSVQGSVRKFGDDKSIQGSFLGEDKSIQNAAKLVDKSAQGTIQGEDKSVQGSGPSSREKSVQGIAAPSRRDQSAQGESYKTIPVSDSVSLRSFGMQIEPQNSDKSIQQNKEQQDQSNQYDEVEVVNRSLQNSLAGSDKEVQIEAEQRDHSVQPSHKSKESRSIQQTPEQKDRSIQRTEPNNVNYRSIERSINQNDSRTVQSKDHSEAKPLDPDRKIQQADMSNVSERNEKQIELERILREKELELGRIRKQVQLKERESLLRKSMEKEIQQKKEREAKTTAEADNAVFKKDKQASHVQPDQNRSKVGEKNLSELRMSNNFMRNAEAPSPIPHSEVLRKDAKMENPLREPDVFLAEKQEPALQNVSRSKYPPPYESNPNTSQIGTKSKLAQQEPSQYGRIEEASEPRVDEQAIAQQPEGDIRHGSASSQRRHLKSSSSKTIEDIKEMLDELKDNKSAQRAPQNNNFTFNKDEVIEAESKLSQEDLQNMRSLKSELSNSKRIEVIEEEQSQIMSQKRQQTKPVSQREAELRLQPETVKQAEEEDEMHTSNDNKFGGKTRKTKGGDESSKDQIVIARPVANIAHTDDSRLENAGMKDILSQPEPHNARMKFKGRNNQVSPEIEQRQFELNLSEDDESHHDSSRPPTEGKAGRTRKEGQKRAKYQYEETNKQHEEQSKYKFSVDNEDIEKSVRDSEDELYKQPISFFPQTKKHSTIGSRESGIQRQSRSPQREQSEKTLEDYVPSNIDAIKKDKSPAIKTRRNKMPNQEERDRKQMTGPIMLTAGHQNGGRGDSGDKRLSKPIIKKSPLKDDLKTAKNANRPEVLESESDLSESAYDPLDRTIQNRSNALTQQSRDESEKVPQRVPPRKPNLMYDTSGIIDGDSIDIGDVGISPSEFNQYNQRYEQGEKGAVGGSQMRIGGRNDMPMKPQIITVSGTSKNASNPSIPRRMKELSPMERDPELHRRIPMMINTLGFQEAAERSNSRGRSRETEKQMRSTVNNNEIVDEDLKDYYGTRNLRPKDMKVDKQLEKIYLQKQPVLKRNPRNSTSRQRL